MKRDQSNWSRTVANHATRAVKEIGRKTLIAVAIASAAAAMVVPGGPLNAQSVIRVSNDYGGVVSFRAQIVAQINSSGQRVEIREGDCQSSCTMYLGARNVCVGRAARFGFHGPSMPVGSGQTISRLEFDRVSAQMAEYYPPQLRAWFMQTGRFATSNPYILTGSQLIAMGVPECR